MRAETPIRIVIAGDEAMVREALTRLIEAEPGLEVVGEASNTAEAAAALLRLDPEILLLDLTGGRDGFEALEAIVAAGLQRTRVIVLTAGAEAASVVRALEAGACGVVPKASDTAVLFESIRTVAQGRYWLGDRQVHDLIAAMQELARRTAPGGGHPSFRLTPRERQIVAYVTDGYSNKDIAARCAVREDTIKHHLSSIFAKVGVRTRLELAMFAVQNGLAVPKDPLV
jgi:DNA-binding NarL/FixJ family response regulator